MRVRRPRGAVLSIAATGVLLSFAVAIPAAAASPTGANKNVVNGSPVGRPGRTVPWAVSLYSSADGESTPDFLCSATALSAREILTAAHCVDSDDLFFVRVGADTLGRGRLIAVEAINSNAAYRYRTTTDDVAVLRTVEPMGLRSYAQLGSVTMAAAVRSGKVASLTLYGWGMNENGNLTGHLRSAVLVSQTRAAKASFGANFKPDRMLAAGRFSSSTRLYSGACHGDSGGPLVVHNAGIPYVVGITSFGAGSCTSQEPTVFTSVGNYISWIRGARRTLPSLAMRDNRALPVMHSPASISGAMTVGTILTCKPGTWSSNAKSYTYQWFRGFGGVPISSAAGYALTQRDAGNKLTCAVTAASAAGAVTTRTHVTPGRAPTSTGALTISGLDLNTQAPAPLGSVATCTPPVFAPADVTVVQTWAVERADGATQQLSTDSTLVLSAELQSLLGGNHLTCSVVATTPMGTTSYGTRRYFAPFLPSAVVASIVPVPVLAGTTATCTATADVDVTLTYQWAIEPEPTYAASFSAAATLRGVGPTHALTDADVTALGGGSKLACQATATSWLGTSSHVWPMI